MLDIRAVAYIAPVSEVEFASVALTVRLVNFADETGLVSGTFRVYDDYTGLLIHSSDIVPVSLGPGASVDASALTDFDPPAPADDVYFVLFDGNASNALVPRGIDIHRGAFYFDVKPVGMGPAPEAHHATHEAGGSDEVDVTDLSGLLADAQTPLAHATSHESGGSDELDLDGLTGLDHHDLDGLSANDHPQYQRVAVQTLTDGASIAWDLNAGGHAVVTLGGNRALANPSNLVAGALYSLRITQDATGSRTLSFGSNYKFPGAVAPTLTSTASAVDIIMFLCNGTNLYCIGATFDVK
jgi:hypothetical protein